MTNKLHKIEKMAPLMSENVVSDLYALTMGAYIYLFIYLKKGRPQSKEFVYFERFKSSSISGCSLHQQQ